MPIRNWGDLIQDAGAEGEGFDPIPAGDYNFVISQADATQTSTQKSMFKVRCKVEDPGPHQNRLVFYNFVVSPESPKALSIFFRQMNVLGLGKEFFQANPDDATIAQHLVGKRFRGTVKIGEWNGSPNNEISAFNTPIAQSSVAMGPGMGFPTPTPTPAPQQYAQPVQQAVPAPAPQQYAPPAAPAPAPAPAQQYVAPPAPAAPQQAAPPAAPQQAAPAAPPAPPVAPPAPPVAEGNVPPPPPFDGDVRA